MNWQLLFKDIMQTEENVVPMFVHNPKSQGIAAVIIMAESIFANLIPTLTTPPTPPAPPTAK